MLAETASPTHPQFGYTQRAIPSQHRIRPQSYHPARTRHTLPEAGGCRKYRWRGALHAQREGTVAAPSGGKGPALHVLRQRGIAARHGMLMARGGSHTPAKERSRRHPECKEREANALGKRGIAAPPGMGMARDGTRSPGRGLLEHSERKERDANALGQRGTAARHGMCMARGAAGAAGGNGRGAIRSAKGRRYTCSGSVASPLHPEWVWRVTALTLPAGNRWSIQGARR